MRLRSGLLIGLFGLIVVLLGGWYFTIAIALLTYIALLEFFRIAERFRNKDIWYENKNGKWQIHNFLIKNWDWI